jgi:plasmid segregation protein ParM
LDIGYSYTKGIDARNGRVRFPSVVAPAQELALADFSRGGPGHLVEIRYLNGGVRRCFVGELALREGRAATFTMEREKYLHPNYEVLLLAAARLLGAGSGAELAVGLPVAYYRGQRESLGRRLAALHAEVGVDGLPPRRISFGRVLVYPQAAGALLTAPDLPGSGLVCLVDVGFKTTDFVTAEISDGRARPVSSLCGSLEAGVSTAHALLAAAYQALAGAPANPARLEGMLRAGRAAFRGRELDLSRQAGEARLAAARAVADGVLAALGPRADEVGRFYLAGGGADALPELEGMFPGAVEKLPDPQFSNALGFLKALTGTF